MLMIEFLRHGIDPHSARHQVKRSATTERTGWTQGIAEQVEYGQ